MDTHSHSKLALVTGASSGIGVDLAEVLARDGYDVVLVARTGAKLREVAARLEADHRVKSHILEADLADPDAPESILARLKADHLTPTVLVNNAGFGLYGPFAETDLQREANMLEVNVVALTKLTKLLLPGMLAAKSGYIMNVASTAAFQAGPLMAVYYATKAYVLSFSEALNNELKGSGVSVTTLCPGPTKTRFVENADLQDSKLFKSNTVMDSMDVAKIGYDGLKRRKSVVIPGLRNKVLAFSTRFLPRTLVTNIVRGAQERVSA